MLTLFSFSINIYILKNPYIIWECIKKINSVKFKIIIKYGGNNITKLKYFSIFSGIGGFEYGIEQSCVDAECVGHSEINKYAESIYQAHYGGYNYGDANYINTSELPEFDFLVGGFPCQSFSSAGYQMGFDDTRGTLFFEIARILKDKRPQYILLENVKNLLSHNEGNTFHKITQVLAELGYVLEWKIYNAPY